MAKIPSIITTIAKFSNIYKSLIYESNYIFYLFKNRFFAQKIEEKTNYANFRKFAQKLAIILSLICEALSRDTQAELALQRQKGQMMKKIFLLTLALASVAFADTGSIDSDGLVKAFSVLAAGLGLGVAALGGAIGMGHTAAATIAGTARNPGLGGKLMTTMFIALAMIEAQVIYALVIALIALYANPFGV